MLAKPGRSNARHRGPVLRWHFWATASQRQAGASQGGFMPSAVTTKRTALPLVDLEPDRTSRPNAWHVGGAGPRTTLEMLAWRSHDG